MVSYETIVNLIGNTSTKTGLHIQAKPTAKKYPTGIKVSNTDLAKINLKPAKFHGELDYSILPALE